MWCRMAMLWNFSTVESILWYSRLMAEQKLDIEGKVDLILDTVVKVDEEVREIKETMATKDYVEVVVDAVKEEWLREIRPIGRAVDKDAVAIISHGQSIGQIKKHLALK